MSRRAASRIRGWDVDGRWNMNIMGYGADLSPRLSSGNVPCLTHPSSANHWRFRIANFTHLRLNP
jgi:hypothetical protein